MRNKFFRFLFALVIAAGVSSSAHSRDSNGRLLFLKYPISTRPEFVLNRGNITFDVAASVYDSCTCSFHAYLLVGTDRKELSSLTREADPASGTYRFSAPLPADTPPGLYDLSVHKGANDDTSRRAVNVLSEFKNDYTFLHVTDVHVGRQNHDNYKGAATLQFEQMSETANTLKPDMVFITGDLSYIGSPEELKLFVDLLDKFDAPTFVLAGNHDAKRNEADNYLGSSNYSFSYGKDFYVSLDTQTEIILPDKTGRIDWLKSELQQHPDAALETLLTHQNDKLDPKAFLDAIAPAKIDLALSGHIHFDAKRKAGKTLFLTTGAYADGLYRVIKIEDGKVAFEKQIQIKRNESKYFIDKKKDAGNE